MRGMRCVDRTGIGQARRIGQGDVLISGDDYIVYIRICHNPGFQPIRRIRWVNSFGRGTYLRHCIQRSRLFRRHNSVRHSACLRRCFQRGRLGVRDQAIEQPRALLGRPGLNPGLVRPLA